MVKKNKTEHVLTRFSRNLTALMRKRDISQANISAFLEKNQSTISQWMNAKAMPTAENLVSLSILLECDVQDFFRPKPGITKSPTLIVKDFLGPEDHLKALGEALGYHVTVRKKA